MPKPYTDPRAQTVAILTRQISFGAAVSPELARAIAELNAACARAALRSDPRPA